MEALGLGEVVVKVEEARASLRAAQDQWQAAETVAAEALKARDDARVAVRDAAAEVNRRLDALVELAVANKFSE